MDFMTVSVLGIPLSCVSTETLLQTIGVTIKERVSTRYIAITNTESLYYANKRQSHRDYIRSATFSCCDGVGVVLAGKMKGYDIPRIYGPTLMGDCCRCGVDLGWRHFFYGGKEGVAEQLAKELTDKYPGLITAGTFCPPFRPLTPEEDDFVIRLINEASPDILWVGLGLLKQEQWIAEHLKKIHVPWMVGVGAAFDFHSGTVVRAPEWISKAGFEWLYRLLREPRMFKRNLRSIPFLFMAMKDAVACRLQSFKKTAPGVLKRTSTVGCHASKKEKKE
jgi:N-acetylglucosaminyldiphosphoundecaprenol N-acetyl-beta-D-mannosaminyltransferase